MKTTSEPDDEAELMCEMLLELPIHQQREQLDWLENNNPDLLKRVSSIMERARKEAGA